MILGFFAMALSLLGCGEATRDQDSQIEFWNALSALCGQAFEGTLAEGSENARASFGAQVMVMHVRHCSDTRIDVPFHVGEDRSRTWVFTRQDEGLRLKHDHRHEDGSEDEITQYGGDTAGDGTATVQEFPADAFSIEMFAAHVEETPGLAGAEFNVWTVEVRPGEVFAYQLTRSHDPDTRFRVEFDLSARVPAPPPAWGQD
jgi:hypothetical protein